MNKHAIARVELPAMAQQQAVEPAGVYEQFAVVAQDTWKLSGGEKLQFDMNLGGFKWECTFITYPGCITYRCENNNKDIRFEICVCDDKLITAGQTAKPKRFDNRWSESFSNSVEYVILTIRVLKRRSALPDFTSEHVKIGNLNSNHTLKVSGQTFHVNKELLSMYSHFFDRMFNGSFDEAKKAENELVTERANPKLFHDFLSFMVFPTDCQVLPNRINVVGLMVLARFYQVDLLVEHCVHFLENCNEMPVWERIVAAKKLGLKDLENRIANKLNTMPAWKELALNLINSG